MWSKDSKDNTKAWLGVTLQDPATSNSRLGVTSPKHVAVRCGACLSRAMAQQDCMCPAHLCALLSLLLCP